MNRERIDIWARDLRMNSQEKIIFTLFGERGEATIGEMIEALYRYRDDGGPGNPYGVVRTTLCSLRKKLDGRATIEPTKLYEIKINGLQENRP